MFQSDAGGYNPTFDADAGSQLTFAFDQATDHVSDQTMAALNDAAIDFVDRLKSDGMGPERVIVALKAALRTGHLREWSWFPSLDVSNDWASIQRESTVYAQLFGWCVEAYYDQIDASARRRRDVRRRSRASTPAWLALV